MGRYVARRLLQMIPVLLGTTFIVYALVFALPGDPFAGRCGDRPCPQAYIDAQTEKYNLDDPLPVQYGKYLKNLAQGDLGESFAGVPVSEALERVYPTTIRLTLVALGFIILLGVSSGVVAAIRRRGIFDSGTLAITLVLISIPVFVTGYLGQYYVGIKWDVLPPTSTDGTWKQLLMPGFVLASLSLAYASRITRGALVENLRADYVRTARAKGMPNSRVIGIHALRNSMIPVITFIGADVGALMGGAIITEGVFNVDGVGGLIFQSIRLREGTTVVGTVTVLILIFLLINLIVDLLYAVLDPRIRYE